MSRDEVHEHAQGRVFTGADAYDVGLVDVIGDLDKAITVAAEMAEVEEYNLEVFPKSTDFFEMMFSSANARIRASVQGWRAEEHTSELQSRGHLVCRLLLEKKRTTRGTGC